MSLDQARKSIYGKETQLDKITQARTKRIKSSKYQQQDYQQSQEVLTPFEDNILNFFSTGNSPSPELFHKFNFILKQKESDFSILTKIWNSPIRQNLKASIDFIVKPDNWAILKYDYKQPLQQFMNICLSKIQGRPFWRQIYPGLYELIARIEKTIDYRQIKPKNPIDPNSDLLYSHYLEEISSLNKREGAYFIRQEVKQQNQNGSSPQITQKTKKVPIGEYIACSNFYDGKEGWDDIFFRASVHKQLEEDKKYATDKQYQQDKKIKDYINQQLLTSQYSILQPPMAHLCCARYFFINQSMYKSDLSAFPVLLEREFAKLNKSIDGIKTFKQLQETMMDICALLNSGGGVILFNVQKNYLHYQAKGEVITISEFLKATSAIQNQLKKIKPKVTLNEEIFVTFVPVANNLQRTAVAGQPLTVNFIEGNYMMRIVVRPKNENGWKTYFLSIDEQNPFWIGRIINNQRLQVPFTNGQQYRFMKRKFKFYYVKNCEQLEQEQIQMLRKSYSFFKTHENCSQPLSGLPLKAHVVNQNYLTDKQLQKKYKYLTLLVAPPSKFQTVRDKLRAKGIDCQVAVKFQKYKFRNANNSAALFHNIRFDKLLAQVAYKKDYEFEKRFILTILVTETLKLTKSITKADFDNLSGWIDKQYPNEKLILFEWKEGDTPSEFYIKTDSKSSTLFVYFVLSQFKEKCALKTPKNYEKKTKQERSNLIKILYEFRGNLYQ